MLKSGSLQVGQTCIPVQRASCGQRHNPGRRPPEEKLANNDRRTTANTPEILRRIFHCQKHGWLQKLLFLGFGFLFDCGKILLKAFDAC
jgi:hypothetical protein